MLSKLKFLTFFTQTKDFKKTKLFFKEIAKNKNIPNIVIRPHPSEDIAGWKEITKYSKNFFIEKPNYDVGSAILASNFVLHRGSTTGYHALAFNKPTAYLNLLNENNIGLNGPYKLAEFPGSWKINYLSWKKKKKFEGIVIKYEDLIDNTENEFKKI